MMMQFALLTVSTVKNLKFQKSKMAAKHAGRRHLKKSKNRHISAAVLLILTKSGTVTHSALLTVWPVTEI